MRDTLYAYATEASGRGILCHAQPGPLWFAQFLKVKMASPCVNGSVPAPTRKRFTVALGFCLFRKPVARNSFAAPECSKDVVNSLNAAQYQAVLATLAMIGSGLF